MNIKSFEHIYLIGIGGIGMSALARFGFTVALGILIFIILFGLGNGLQSSFSMFFTLVFCYHGFFHVLEKRSKQTYYLSET